MVDRRGRNANRLYQEFFSLLEYLPLLDHLPPRKRAHHVKPRKQEQTRLEAEKASELIQLYQSGATVYELAETFSVHRQTVSAILKRNKVRMRRTVLSEAEIDRAIEFYDSGLSLAKVGARLDRTASTIRRVLLAQGVPIRDSHGRPRLGTAEDTEI